MRTLVAGGAGFIGSHVCAELLHRGHEVTCLDNLSTGSLDNVSSFEDHPGFSFLHANVSQTPFLPVDLVVHLASASSPAHCRELPIETMLANSAGTHRLLALAADTGARFVYASSEGVYGDAAEHPQREACRGSVDTTGVRACHDEAKRFGEALTFEYRRAHAVNATVARVFNTYGPRMHMDAGDDVSEFVAAALHGRPLPLRGDGSQTRSCCYIDDVVDGLLLAALDPASDGMVLNIGHPDEVSLLELAQIVATALGTRLRVEPLLAEDAPTRRCPDVSRMRERYGWAPRVPLGEGVARTVAFAREAASGRSAAA